MTLEHNTWMIHSIQDQVMPCQFYLLPSISPTSTYSKDYIACGPASCQSWGNVIYSALLVQPPQVTPCMDFGGSFSHNASNLAPQRREEVEEEEMHQRSHGTRSRGRREWGGRRPESGGLGRGAVPQRLLGSSLCHCMTFSKLVIKAAADTTKGLAVHSEHLIKCSKPPLMFITC